ncbi:hypothetical protein [Hydrogenophaga sp. PAMC20947]|uniref:hypothetical protein n=1 Tax=Hydrogenophaga sp. PAMC20947 TaxID=2565558 RepID=UPI00109E2EF1|nr:hypothetical protein [Hydrogenophaga sp. PAMC20947]QCB46519.1 hypothetical protein E5678_11060 [Hydrogenophaga sp. PAMC20947]
MDHAPSSTQTLTRQHHRRLRDLYRSAGWPSQDMLEVELLAAGQIERVRSGEGHETLRVTDAGIATLARVFASNKAARSPHEELVQRVALEMTRGGRLAWRGLMLRVALPKALLLGEEPAPQPESPGLALDDDAGPLPKAPGHAWCMAMPDVFSIRRTSVEAYAEPVVHEIKVSRADLLGDLKKPAKRAAYLGMAGACWYVLGQDAKGRSVGAPDEVPVECGVMLVEGDVLKVAREAPRRAVAQLPFHVWMALAKAGPAVREEDRVQARW